MVNKRGFLLLCSNYCRRNTVCSCIVCRNECTSPKEWNAFCSNHMVSSSHFNVFFSWNWVAVAAAAFAAVVTTEIMWLLLSIWNAVCVWPMTIVQFYSFSFCFTVHRGFCLCNKKWMDDGCVCDCFVCIAMQCNAAVVSAVTNVGKDCDSIFKTSVMWRS